MKDKIVCWICGSKFDTKREHDRHYVQSHPECVTDFGDTYSPGIREIDIEVYI